MPGPPASDIAQRQSSRIGEARAWLEVITRPQWTPNRVSSGGKTFEGSSEWPPAPKASWPESLALAAALCCWPLAIPAPCPWAASGSSSGANPQPACPNPTLTFPSPSLGCKGPSPSPSETHRDLRGTCPLGNPTPLPHQPPGAGWGVGLGNEVGVSARFPRPHQAGRRRASVLHNVRCVSNCVARSSDSFSAFTGCFEGMSSLL